MVNCGGSGWPPGRWRRRSLSPHAGSHADSSAGPLAAASPRSAHAGVVSSTTAAAHRRMVPRPERCRGARAGREDRMKHLADGCRTDTSPHKRLKRRTDMKRMGRRGFLAASTALGIGAGLSTHAILSEASENETADKTSDISRRDQDLPFIGAEETFSTPALLKLNSINQDHIAFLEEIGLSDLGQRRIGDMDAGGLNVQILSAHTPS